MEDVPNVLNVGALTVLKDKVPDPSVWRYCPLVPSVTFSASIPTLLSAITLDVIFVFAI
jgi:hypothetical protein